MATQSFIFEAEEKIIQTRNEVIKLHDALRIEREVAKDKRSDKAKPHVYKENIDAWKCLRLNLEMLESKTRDLLHELNEVL